MLMTLVLSMSLGAAPLESRLFIASGAKTEAEAKQQLAALKPPPALVLAPGYPRLLRSDGVEGLKPGFVLVVLGACADRTAAQSGHNDGLAALLGRALKGAYAKPVQQQAEACPLWLEPGDEATTKAARAKPDDTKALGAAARALEQAGDLVGAAMLLRRALALGAGDDDTLGLARKVEFLMEDLPERLPR